MNENDDFDAEMKADETMGLYQRLWNKQESPRSLDQKVLENYQKAFPSKQNKTTLFNRWFRKFRWTPQPSRTLAINWAIPASLVGGIILGIMLNPLIKHPSPDSLTGFKGKTLDDPHFIITNGQQVPPAIPAPQRDSLKFHPSPGELSPEEWLESVAELLVQGRVTDAQARLDAFRKRYPNYEKSTEN